MFNSLINLITPYSLAIINIIIILLGFNYENYMVENGLIHLLVIIFSFLSLVVILNFSHLQDQLFRNIFKGFSVMLIIFSINHLLEYLGIILLNEEEGKAHLLETIDVSMLVSYAVGIATALMGFEKISTMYSGKKSKIFWVYAFIILVLITTLSILLAKEKGELIEFFEENNSLPILFVILNVILVIVAITKSIRVGKNIPTLKNFMKYIKYCFIFTLGAVLFEFMEISGLSALSEETITLLAHFTFYIALSFELLAFKQLFALGGLYEEMQSEK